MSGYFKGEQIDLTLFTTAVKQVRQRLKIDWIVNGKSKFHSTTNDQGTTG